MALLLEFLDHASLQNTKACLLAETGLKGLQGIEIPQRDRVASALGLPANQPPSPSSLSGTGPIKAGPHVSLYASPAPLFTVLVNERFAAASVSGGGSTSSGSAPSVSGSPASFNRKQVSPSVSAGHRGLEDRLAPVPSALSATVAAGRSAVSSPAASSSRDNGTGGAAESPLSTSFLAARRAAIAPAALSPKRVSPPQAPVSPPAVRPAVATVGAATTPMAVVAAAGAASPALRSPFAPLPRYVGASDRERDDAQCSNDEGPAETPVRDEALSPSTRMILSAHGMMPPGPGEEGGAGAAEPRPLSTGASASPAALGVLVSPAPRANNLSPETGSLWALRQARARDGPHSPASPAGGAASPLAASPTSAFGAPRPSGIESTSPLSGGDAPYYRSSSAGAPAPVTAAASAPISMSRSFGGVGGRSISRALGLSGFDVARLAAQYADGGQEAAVGAVKQMQEQRASPATLSPQQQEAVAGRPSVQQSYLPANGEVIHHEDDYEQDEDEEYVDEVDGGGEAHGGAAEGAADVFASAADRLSQSEASAAPASTHDSMDAELDVLLASANSVTVAMASEVQSASSTSAISPSDAAAKDVELREAVRSQASTLVASAAAAAAASMASPLESAPQTGALPGASGASALGALRQRRGVTDAASLLASLSGSAPSSGSGGGSAAESPSAAAARNKAALAALAARAQSYLVEATRDSMSLVQGGGSPSSQQHPQTASPKATGTGTGAVVAAQRTTSAYRSFGLLSSPDPVSAAAQRCGAPLGVPPAQVKLDSGAGSASAASGTVNDEFDYELPETDEVQQHLHFHASAASEAGPAHDGVGLHGERDAYADDGASPGYAQHVYGAAVYRSAAPAYLAQAQGGGYYPPLALDELRFDS